jgi:hypothetical protein
MFGSLVRITRLNAGSNVVVIGVAVAGLAALAGGWAFASLGPGTLP